MARSGGRHTKDGPSIGALEHPSILPDAPHAGRRMAGRSSKRSAALDGAALARRSRSGSPRTMSTCRLDVESVAEGLLDSPGVPPGPLLLRGRRRHRLSPNHRSGRRPAAGEAPRRRRCHSTSSQVPSRSARSSAGASACPAIPGDWPKRHTSPNISATKRRSSRRMVLPVLSRTQVLSRTRDPSSHRAVVTARGQARARSWCLIGRLRTRMPVAAWIALVAAAAIGGTPGSPRPPMWASERISSTLIRGASARRII